MPDDEKRTEWERVAALIEACRVEREACASVRDQMLGWDLQAGTSLAAMAMRLNVSPAGCAPPGN